MASGTVQMSIGQKVRILQSSRAIFSTADYFFPLNLYINLNIFILNLNIYKFKYINLNI